MRVAMLLALFAAACAATGGKGGGPGAGTVPEAPAVVELRRPVHFVDREGAVAATGAYCVEAGEKGTLRLVSASGAPLVVPAVEGRHELALDGGLALSAAKEEEDRFDLALFLPGGRMLAATGSFSGARPRGEILNPWGIKHIMNYPIRAYLFRTFQSNYLVPRTYHQIDINAGMNNWGASLRFLPPGEALAAPRIVNGVMAYADYPSSELPHVLQTVAAPGVSVSAHEFNNGNVLIRIESGWTYK